MKLQGDDSDFVYKVSYETLSDQMFKLQRELLFLPWWAWIRKYEFHQRIVAHKKLWATLKQSENAQLQGICPICKKVSRDPVLLRPVPCNCVKPVENKAFMQYGGSHGLRTL